MTHEHQMDYATKLVNQINHEILQGLEQNADNIKNWNGAELRQYVADYYSLIPDGCIPMTTIERREFRLTIKKTDLYGY